MTADGPPPIERLRKIGELYEDPETGWIWQLYDPPLGDVVMQAQFLDDAEVEEALELDEDGVQVFYTYDHPEGLVCRDREWRDLDG